jgi:DNA-binding NtrC family response regulator/tetratricopeptide (TPR) repeat protein
MTRGANMGRFARRAARDGFLHRGRTVMLAMLADRFVREESGEVFDLATAQPVLVVQRTVASGRERLDWLARCEKLASVRHTCLVPLLDFVWMGPTTALEVYARAPGQRRRVAAPAWVWRAAADFFHTQELCFGVPDPDRVRLFGDRWSLLPDAITGTPITDVRQARDEDAAIDARYPTPRRRFGSRWSGRAFGYVLTPPPGLDVLVAALETLGVGGPFRRDVAEASAPSSHVFGTLAREARRLGLIPICPASIRLWPPLVTELRGRRLALFSHLEAGREPNDELACAAAALHRACAIVAVMLTSGPSRPSLARAGLLPTRLSASATFFPPLSPRAALEQAWLADGIPSVLEQRWLHRTRVSNARGVTHVSDRGLRYGAEVEGPANRRGDEAGKSADFDGDGWPNLPITCETRTLLLHREVRRAHACLESSRTRHEQRGDRTALAEVFVSRGWLALYEADVSLARISFDRAAELSAAVHHPLTARLSLFGLGLAALESGDLHDSERHLRTVLAVALNSEPLTATWIRLALVRCLLWQGRAREAAAHHSHVVHASPSARVQALRYAARLELWKGSARRAGAWLDRARVCATALADRTWHAGVMTDTARLAAVVGCTAAAERYLVNGGRDACRARACHRQLRARLLQIEFRARDGREASCSAVRALGHRLLGRGLPGLLRLRVHYALERVGCARSREVAVFVERYGKRMLDPFDESEGDAAMVNDLQAILEICRDTPEPAPAMTKVCTLVRDRLAASLVAVYGAPADGRRLSHAGSLRLASTEAARRAIASGLLVRPTEAGDAMEAAAPIAYAGRTIGAVTCRWGVEAVVAEQDAETLLVAAAAAVAPHVQCALDGQAQASRPADAGASTLVGDSPPMRTLRDTIVRVAAAPFHALIEGESGSGKELVARALHAAGPRRFKRFCAVNCAAITDELLEAELFGHARGAFTGAVSERPGLFEDADGGTLFLDEVSELSVRAQAKLLRVIQDGEVRRVGENLPRRVDTRIVAATNRPLIDEVTAGRFRADLWYRLDVIRLTVPPLRDRLEDIPVLAKRFWAEATARLGSRAVLHANTVIALARYHWPGNVRELQNVIMALAVHAPPRGFVGPDCLPAAVGAAAGLEPRQTLDAARRCFEERYVRAALARAGGRHTRAARELGLTRQGLRKLLNRLGIAAIDSPRTDALETPRAENRVKRSDVGS